MSFKGKGAARYRELAQWFFDFQRRCVDPWDGGSSGKGGWGAAMLYRITGETRYRDAAFRVGHQIVARQNADGGWAFPSSEEEPIRAPGLTNMDLDATAEFILWLTLISGHVLARDTE